MCLKRTKTIATLEIGIEKVVIMKNKPQNCQYCMYTGEPCTNCRKCDHIPQNVIVNNMPKSDWSSKLVICLLIFLIIFLLIMLIPYMMMNVSDNLMKEPIDNSYDNPIQLSNYELQNSYGGSDIQNYYTNQIPSTSNELPRDYVINTTGESYNSMRI